MSNQRSINTMPALVSLLANGLEAGLVYLVAVGIPAVIGISLGRLRPSPGIQPNEALVITSATLLAAALTMSLPFAYDGLHFGDAVFESISAVTTTGLSMTESVANKPVSFLFARSWLQWYGGLGIVVVSVALLVRPAPAIRRLASTENASTEFPVDVRAHARRVSVVYLILTGASLLTLFLLGLRPLAAITYTLSSVSTGGFAVDDASLAGLSGWMAPAAILLSAFLGAGSFSWYYRRFWGTNERPTRRGLTTVGLPLMTLIIALALIGTLRYVGVMSWTQAIGHGVALGVTAQTTTGFTTTDIAALPAAAKALVMVAMFIGGDLGSTAGGIKLIRFFIVLRLFQRLLVRTTTPPHAVLTRRLGGRKLSDRTALDGLVVIALFVVTILLSWFVLLLYNYDPLNSLFDVVSATCTVGLSTGVTGPALPEFPKTVLCVDMLMGRLEMIALLVLFYPRTWIGKRADIS